MRNFKYTNILPDSANSIINFYTRLIHREAILHSFVYHQKLKMLIISKQNFLCNQISRFSRSIIDKTDYFSDRNSIQNFHPVCKVLSGKINRTKIRILFIIFSKVQSKVPSLEGTDGSYLELSNFPAIILASIFPRIPIGKATGFDYYVCLKVKGCKIPVRNIAGPDSAF